MWPKAFAQLIELAPHISRLLPMADRFFQSKTASDDATRKSVETLAEKVHGDLGQIVATHAGLSKQISELSNQLSQVSQQATVAAAEARAAKAAADSLESRLSRIEQAQSGLRTLVAIALVCLAVALALLVAILLRGH